MRLPRQFQACLFYFFTKRFCTYKLLRGWKLLECILVLFVGAKFFHKKKINRREIVLITSFYYNTDMYQYQPTYRDFVCTLLFLLLINCENLFFLWESFWILLNCESVRIYFFLSLYENKQAWSSVTIYFMFLWK